MRRLTKEEIETLNNLVNDEELIKKGFLKRFIFVNTYKPKYNIGDFVKFTCYGEYVYGNLVKDFVGKIVDIKFICGTIIELKDLHIQYVIVSYDDNGTEFTHYVEEYPVGKGQRFISGRTNETINYIKRKSSYSQSTIM